jgi:hypothetical protein
MERMSIRLTILKLSLTQKQVNCLTHVSNI